MDGYVQLNKYTHSHTHTHLLGVLLPQDTSGQGGPVFRPLADGPALAGVRPRYDLGGGSGGGSGYQSSLDSFEEFLKR